MSMSDKRSALTEEYWRRSVAFHGHECGGLTIGYKAAIYAIELLELKLSEDAQNKITCISDDEQVVCISENDACGVDAIQVILGCSVGKGNLLFHMTGKQAFSFYNRRTGKSVRLVLKPRPEGLSREESFDYFQNLEQENMFDVKEATLPLPESARIFVSMICDCCKETAGSNWMRLQGEKKVCLDCYNAYDRFHV